MKGARPSAREQEEVYEWLRAVARRKGTTNYTEAGQRVGCTTAAATPVPSSTTSANKSMNATGRCCRPSSSRREIVALSQVKAYTRWSRMSESDGFHVAPRLVGCSGAGSLALCIPYWGDP